MMMRWQLSAREASAAATHEAEDPDSHWPSIAAAAGREASTCKVFVVSVIEGETVADGVGKQQPFRLFLAATGHLWLAWQSMCLTAVLVTETRGREYRRRRHRRPRPPRAARAGSG
jgi:hypothetical protein